MLAQPDGLTLPGFLQYHSRRPVPLLACLLSLLTACFGVPGAHFLPQSLVPSAGTCMPCHDGSWLFLRLFDVRSALDGNLEIPIEATPGKQRVGKIVLDIIVVVDRGKYFAGVSTLLSLGRDTTPQITVNYALSSPLRILNCRCTRSHRSHRHPKLTPLQSHHHYLHLTSYLRPWLSIHQAFDFETKIGVAGTFLSFGSASMWEVLFCTTLASLCFHFELTFRCAFSGDLTSFRSDINTISSSSSCLILIIGEVASSADWTALRVSSRCLLGDSGSCPWNYREIFGGLADIGE
jgi:hypothetical protein